MPGGRKLPGGPRPQEQIVATAIVLALAALVSAFTDLNVAAIFGVAAIVEALTITILSLIKYDGISTIYKIQKILTLLADRSPVVVSAEDLDRQAVANPAAFLTPDDTSTESVETFP